MARYTGPRGRRDRRAGVMLSSMRKNPLERKPYPPGEHGRDRQRQTEYGIRLMEKQKARWYYGVSEKQFRRAYEEAIRQPGVSGENLLRLMELRMDNVVYRMGFATSRPQARQLVVHGHFLLNGRKHNIPSATLKPGDVITVREKSRRLQPIQDAVEQVVAVPAWLEADHENFTGRVLHAPSRDEIDAPVEEQLIIEFYSR
ncbi:30S ribosomal protein S4 [Rubrobacter xylanophilus DSM 9941]|uniref:Small ribosomal subunit protein uS4 n=1 Tax=Rubrobacter xylanophilus TaxID=49319 RepID=A0A510HM89_9ACTN|nr:30S ribosomal protein S4 [Rubrobacter xylanophilus]QYJ15288.1 30S ribosomal protein S4 [Rubrobacter xylanophilus DSM 9941]BBL79557.1 30S ribosomal protein S4 [Rubrobacter xylanophilus]